MKRFLLCSVIGLLLFSGCTENIDTSARFVYKDQTIAKYLSSHPQFSEYVKLMKQQKLSDLSETTVYQLLSAYGYYTVFAPSNEALQLYLDTLALNGTIPEASWDKIPSQKILDSLRNVVIMNSIIDGTAINRTYCVWDFPQNHEEFSLPTLADRKISVVFEHNNSDSCYIDGKCFVSVKNRDIIAINGLVHELGYVIAPSDESMGTIMHKYANDYGSGLSVWGKLIDACGLVDSLSKIRDEYYESKIKKGEINERFDAPSSHFHNVANPKTRKFGFTLFAESDDFWADALQKDLREVTADDVKDWVVSQGYYPDAQDNGNYKDENNVLNQFVTYHLLDYRLPPDKLVIHYNEKGYNYRSSFSPTIPVWAHYTTMGKRRLLRLWESRESNGVYLNRFPELDNGPHGTYHELSCSPANEGIYLNTQGDSKMLKLINAVIYPIDKVLVYDKHISSELHKTRIRYDILEFSHELMNNDMRNMGYNTSIHFTSDEYYKYFDDLDINCRDTYFYILNGWGSDWPNYQADEVCTEGAYDCTWKVPPVPEDGVYEIRMGVSTESSWRGICQVYFGDNKNNLVPSGIPVDMALGGLKRNLDGQIFDSPVGWESDSEDDDYNAEIDKRMRNKGFMKGPEYIVENPGSSVTNRMQEKSTRRIIVREFMRADKTYYLRFKTVQDLLSKQLFIDYIEWCPKEIYDNPNEPEDIW